MKKKIALLLLIAGANILADDTMSTKSALKKLEKKSSTPVKKTEKTIWFQFEKKPLVEVANYLATEKNINLLLPQGPNALKGELTFSFPHKISVDRAWNHFLTILDRSGYSFTEGDDTSYISKIDKNINKEPLPIYINTPTIDIPNTDQRIRYIRYFTTLQVPSTGGAPSYGGAAGGNALQTIFKDLLSKESASPGGLIFDGNLNAVVITDKAANIRSVMSIVDVLETSSTKQTLRLVRLKHANATQVKSLFTELITGVASSPSGGMSGYSPASNTKKFLTGGYFEKSIKVIAEPRTNSLIMLGKKDSLDRMESFVKNHIDVPLDSGDSVLHIYTLQHLDAATITPILKNIVAGSQSGQSSFGYSQYGQSTGQSTSSSSHAGEQYFKNVIITSEGTNSNQFSNSGSGDGGEVSQASQTGNRLIIAATRNDWIRLEKLIRSLDSPQRQLSVQGLIVDMTETAQRELGSQIRNKKDMFLKDLSAQTSHLGGLVATRDSGGNITQASTVNDDTLAGNLMAGTATSNLADNTTRGSTVITVADPNDANSIWWIAQTIDNNGDSKVLSQPYLFGVNNSEITFEDTSSRYLPGSSTVQQGTTVTNQDKQDAIINLTINPRISKNNMINLGVKITVQEWSSGDDNVMTNREITTSVNIKSGDILVLGGLTKTKVSHSIQKTPILGDIPGLGYLFKRKQKSTTKSNIMIFLRPEVVVPSEGLDYFTRERFNESVDALFSGDNFENLKDPISRWFFDSDDITREGQRQVEGIKVHSTRLSPQQVPMPKPKKIKPVPQKKVVTKKEFKKEVEHKLDPNMVDVSDHESAQDLPESDPAKKEGLSHNGPLPEKYVLELNKLFAPEKTEGLKELTDETIERKQEDLEHQDIDTPLPKEETEEERAERELKEMFRNHTELESRL